MEENINTAMLAIMNEVSYIQKERSKDVNYTLKTENAVIQAIRPAMVKHGVFMFPAGVREVEHSQFEAGKYKNIWNRIVATHVYRFVHAPSGTSIDVEVLGDGADTGDKAGNKSMTTSKKYALLEAFLLETGDDPDTTPSGDMTRSAKPAKVTAPPVPSNRPYEAETVKERVQARVQYHLDEQTTASVNDRKVLASILDTTLGDKTKRYELCNWLVGQSSTQKMKQADVNALLDWLGVRQFNAMPEDYVVKEINAAHTAALKASGQQELIGA